MVTLLKANGYCRLTIVVGCLYLKGNGLLWSVYAGLQIRWKIPIAFFFTGHSFEAKPVEAEKR